MNTQALPRTQKYLYAVVAGGQNSVRGAFGINGSPLQTISDGRLAAVVSDVPFEKIRPERTHLAIHQGVLRQLLRETTPLPMSFGTIADGPKAVRGILSRNEAALLKQLHRVEGKVEMGLRVTWSVPNIFELFVNTHPELRVARDHLLGAHRAATQEDKIEIGRLFERMLDDDRERYTDKVEKTLAPYCFEVKRSKCRSEREVMNLACLVGRDKGAEFEEALFEAAKLFDDRLVFDYNGPWAPHNFVELDLKL